MSDPDAALERIKAEAREVLRAKWNDNGAVSNWSRDRIATAEYLGKTLERHASDGVECVDGCGPPYPCPDAAAALALIAQLDGGTRDE
jgi:hypothetical protein